jgi:putative transposase
MRTSYPVHLKHFDYRGRYRYFLTFCTFWRRPHFVRPETVEPTRAQILRAAAEETFAVLAYCFMPDHVHLLIEGGQETSDARRFISRAKQLSGFEFKKQYGEPLWQRYGYERVLRNDEATLSVARYIVENPLRARLVEKVTDYPFIGSAAYGLDDLLAAVQMSPSWQRSG